MPVWASAIPIFGNGNKKRGAKKERRIDRVRLSWRSWTKMANGKCWFYPLRTVRPPILPMPLRFPRKPRNDLGSIPTDLG